MKKLLALALVVFGLAACQTEPEFDVNMGDGTTTISVVLPEDAVTRAGENDSALGGLDNTTGETVRVIFEVYYKGETNADLRQVKYLTEGELQANFDVRLVPGRDYTFVAWADMVDGVNAGDKYYNTSNLKNVTLETNWTAMNESRDAFTATKLVEDFQSTSTIELKLVRPFAKLRIVTTDMEQLNDLGIVPTTATITYASKHYNAFNAFEGKVVAESQNRDIKHENFAIISYGENDLNKDANKTLFTDYFFAGENDVVKFTLNVYDQDREEIGATKDFTTDIPVKRNNLTTILGNVLTEANNIKVEVTPAFEAEYIYLQGDVTLTEDLVLDRPMVVRPGTSAVLDLNGHTITAGLKQEGRHHYAIDNYGTLTLEGEGAINARGIENFGTMTINGNITITNLDTNGGSTIWNEGDLVVNGGTFTTNAMAGVGSYGGALTTQGGSAVINGGNFIANSQLTYAICNYGETVINNATVKGKHGAVASTAAYKTTINGGSFELMENPGVSDHCAYYVSEIKGGKFTLGTNTDSGAQVFYKSTIAEGCVAVDKDNNGIYEVINTGYNIDAQVRGAAELTAALNNAEVEGILLLAGDYGTIVAKSNKTIIGTPGAKVDAVNLNGANYLTLAGIELDAAKAKMAYDGYGNQKQFANIISRDASGIDTVNGAQNLVIDGCTFNGTFTNGGAAIAFTDQKRAGVGNATIKNCLFNTTGAYYHIYGHYTGNGTNGNGNFVIEGNTFKTSTLGPNIYLGRYASSTPVVLKNNVFETVSSVENAIYVQDHSNYGVSVNATGNTFAE